MVVVCHCASLMQLLTMQLLTSLSLRISLPIASLSLALFFVSLSLWFSLSLTTLAVAFSLSLAPLSHLAAAGTIRSATAEERRVPTSDG